MLNLKQTYTLFRFGIVFIKSTVLATNKIQHISQYNCNIIKRVTSKTTEEFKKIMF